MKKFIRNKKTILLLIIFIFLALSFQMAKAIDPPDYSYCQKKGAIDCSLNLDKTTCQYDTNCRWDNTIKTPDLCGLKLEVAWPASPVGTSISSCTTVTGMVKYFYDWAISLGGLAAFIVLIFAGFQYLTSAGNPTAMGEAKSRIQSAVLGIILLLGSWLILNTINPQLTTLIKPTLKPVSPVLPSLGLSKEKMLPCEFAILYPDIDWGGTTEKFEIKDEPETPKKNFKSYVIYRERDSTEEKCTVDRIDGETKKQIQECVPSPKDSTKKVFLEPCNPKFDPDCIKYPDDSTISYNNYKSGGACIMDLYYQSSWWVVKLPGCGTDDKMGSIGASAVDNIKTYTQNPGDIHCLKLTPIKTEKNGK